MECDRVQNLQIRVSRGLIEPLSESELEWEARSGICRSPVVLCGVVSFSLHSHHTSWTTTEQSGNHRLRNDQRLCVAVQQATFITPESPKLRGQCDEQTDMIRPRGLSALVVMFPLFHSWLGKLTWNM